MAITYGTAKVYNTDTSAYNNLVWLDSTHFVAIYQDNGNSGYGTAIIGVVSGTTITTGTEVVFNSASTLFSSVSRIDDTHFAICWSDASNGKTTIGTVSGSSITFGTATTFNSGASYHCSVSVLDSTHMVIAFRDGSSSNYGKAIAGTISGTTITLGSETTFNAGTSDYNNISRLDSTKFAIAYRDGGNSNYGTAVIGTISGTTITFGSEYVFNSGLTSYTSCSALDSTHIAISYQDGGNSNYGTAIVGSISGTVITFGTEAVYNSATIYQSCISALNSTSFVVAYRDFGGDGYGGSRVGSVSGTTITYDTEVMITSSVVGDICVDAFSDTLICAVYQDSGNAGYGTSIIGTLPSTGKTIDATESVTMGDTLITVKIKNITATESFNTSDSLNRTILRLLTESILPNDTLVKEKVITKDSLESVTINDNINKSFIRNLLESISIGGLMNRMFPVTLTESVTIGAVFSKIFVIARNMMESITARDTFGRFYSKNFQESITMVDTFIKDRAKIFSESINIGQTLSSLNVLVREFLESIYTNDSLIKKLNGTIVDIWKKAARITTIWTKVPKDID